MQNIKKILFLFLVLTFSSNLYAAASDEVDTGSSDFETTTVEDEVYDPLEPVNRAIFKFNNFADKVVLEPVAKGYRKLPSPIQSGIGNFIGNLKMPLVIVNQFLQGQGKNAVESTGRFLVNSTIGFFGIVDVADRVGLEETQEDFGQTLATWGVGDGFYLVLPLFGPSNLRDTAGMFITYATDPINLYAANEGEGAWFIPLRTATNAVDQRSQIIDEVNALRNNSVDYYAAVRSSYYQNRKAAIDNTDDNVLTPVPLITIEFD